MLEYATFDNFDKIVVKDSEKVAFLDFWEVPEGERTWPQIFLDGKRLGGYTELRDFLTDPFKVAEFNRT